MPDLPIHKRKFHAFISHAHADKKVVSSLDEWLSQKAGIPIWYDSRDLPPGTMIGTYLPEAVALCRSMILVLSRSSIESGWVKEESEAALSQRTSFKNFRIIPVRIDDCETPKFLATTKWIDFHQGSSGLSTCDEILSSLYYDSHRPELATTRDVYVSRSWRDQEASTANFVCQLMIKEGFGLIGDSQDRASFGQDRLVSIISSCGGFVAVLPDRGGGNTSTYMLDEIEIARTHGLPCLIAADPTVAVPKHLADFTIAVSSADARTGSPAEAAIRSRIEELSEQWKAPIHPHFVFFSTNFDDDKKARNQIIRQAIQRTAAVPCIIGDDIREGQIQQVITRRISDALVVIADISEDNLNTCIEAGIALGSKRPIHFVAREPRRKPPFMFRDQQVFYYADDVELLGIIHRLTYQYRRRVLNWELPS